MGFNADKFSNTKYKDRTADVPVPELTKFFAEDEKPVWTVKCIGANEIAIANEAAESNKNMAKIITALSADNADEKIEAIKEAMGIPGENVQADIARRISMLVSASVSPECDQHIAVKLSNFHGSVFYRITNKILGLIGEGMVGE